ncbi:MAG: hypothetical protein JWN98_1923 [Abditibacteriota bacterium]|nr:hypothetical protein [Abditibacteriota bacterium]
MILGKDGSVVGLMSFLSFAFSVMAAVLAIDMYALLRTGQFGKTWRVLIITTVMFALMQALRLAEVLNFQTFRRYHLSEVVELMFVISLAYAFYLQRSVFISNDKKSSDRQAPPPAPFEESQTDARADEWAHLTGHYDGPLPTSARTPSESAHREAHHTDATSDSLTPEAHGLDAHGPEAPTPVSKPRITS